MIQCEEGTQGQTLYLNQGTQIRPRAEQYDQNPPKTSKVTTGSRITIPSQFYILCSEYIFHIQKTQDFVIIFQFEASRQKLTEAGLRKLIPPRTERQYAR